MKRLFVLWILVFSISNLFGQDEFKKVNFDKKFKAKNQGVARIEIDEVKELIHIMIALTEIGLDNDDMVEQKGPYYQDVLAAFKQYKSEKIILVIDSLIKSNPLQYIFLTGNALSYNFKGNKLVKDRNYLFPAQSVSSHTKISVNPITTYKNQIEAFAVKTGFRKFYKRQKPFYKGLIAKYNELANLQEQWNWLEKNFESGVNNYTIMCSPLINGLNYTTSYESNGFKQIMMVLPPIDRSAEMSDKENEIFSTRIMFTEIDHNYVAKPTKAYQKEINIAFSERARWVDTSKEGTEYYPTPERVFDEYMTYAVFYLYCNEKFAADESSILFAYNGVNALMKDRGFPRMKELNDALLRIRKNNPTKKISELYPELIEWCKTQ
ncbi:DUF4932 domain-containing protein [Flavihumibacter sp. UBA7668]|uniref:DUF4932 domain-containing protein n=1 Tax=Flavihumibacter sp. UBA7668 TaxID=1946542 RepID=UPI0025C5437D|nr:DUF4932 domain-containing protein [Flavihumibacter sp. UBA7668]